MNNVVNDTDMDLLLNGNQNIAQRLNDVVQRLLPRVESNPSDIELADTLLELMNIRRAVISQNVGLTEIVPTPSQNANKEIAHNMLSAVTQEELAVNDMVAKYREAPSDGLSSQFR